VFVNHYKQMNLIAELAETLVVLANYVVLVFAKPYKQM